ncbi:putative arabinose efflux permease, MFS family [Streptoalloteichus tenebrarius]|uniref:Arabinose efflux permease, MFS family n=1 Tax=Streptoalloteichus tenebrarius (strain ATCC 17920 / DSM 40477 / JCM 4838 / CBS 697.72 / NBRC 16177 / NCIMB 11028 / NRRL B-12390 / A12253. 1 / ISP 5477) TaxID=1933 RepID=A0ABT1I0W8_STRSD|nr:MFS transporter [Streptoalloteichus tenebrarius]MCP2261433.1 putative arabinose efflux permease, MFS family [Streptoalloteichus tenebrarius]BFF02037.1 MFS transporter [Streptoalloteichus tenebrarius]
MSTGHHVRLLDAVKGQPRTVWITAFAAVIAFMGIGLVDPILLSIAEALHAGPSQVTLLFSSYLGVQVVAMLLTGASTARFGAKRTLVGGLVLIVLATAACAMVNSIGALVGLRAVWGLGNAFFIATALSVIVGAATGGQQGAILLYEAALGLGMSTGPLLGAVLGSVSWRGPFAGTAVLMGVALILSAGFLPKDRPEGSAEERPRVSVLDPLRALRHRGLRWTAVGSALYTAAFFVVLAWSPFVLRMGAVEVGLIFFGWGLCVAVAGVLFAPRLAARLGERHATVLAVLVYAAMLAVMTVDSRPVLVVAVIVSGLASGLLNTLFTGTAMSISSAPRPVASAGYNFCRWLGGAVAATLVGHVAEWLGWAHAPFLVGAVLCVLSAVVLTVGTAHRPDPHAVPAEAVVVGEEL